jgi:PTH1 family peptidyl-tRNA hydrolase
MIIIVGLGNPGKKYEMTRHNVGFRVVDEFLRKNRDMHYFSDFKFVKKFNSLISEGFFNNEKIILAQPQAFMNLSGETVKSLIKKFSPTKLKINATAIIRSLWVIHDDIDLPLGKIRIVKNRGAAGHKGVESIIRELGTKNFVRFRIGIKPKQYHRLVCGTIEKFVLQKFNKEEEKIVKEVIKKAVEAIEFSLKDYNPPTASSRSPKGERAPGLEKAMSRYNK